MAREERENAKGVSLLPDDDIEAGGIFGPGEATIQASRFAEFEYRKKGATRGVRAPVWLVTFERDGETADVPYGVGSGWKISRDGQMLIPRNGQTGLPKSCNAVYFRDSLIEAGMPDKYMTQPSLIEGAEVTLVLKPIKRDWNDGQEHKDKSLLVVSGVESAPWDEKSKSRGRKRVEDDDEEQERKEKLRASKQNKAREEDHEEEAIEQLLAALDDGPIKLRDLEDVMSKRLKKHEDRDAIAELIASKAFLEQEKGWSFDGRIVTAD